jgi:iron-sulfur cluster assembly protein
MRSRATVSPSSSTRSARPTCAGTEIDWVEGLQAGFAINNPNVSGSCGCGHSFQVEEGGSPEDAAGCGSGCS